MIMYIINIIDNQDYNHNSLKMIPIIDYEDIDDDYDDDTINKC